MLAIRYLLQVVITSICLKLLFIPAYRSTDFEVHRNWMAITSSLPIDKWYFDETSQWTLDYPPLFAYFERLLAIPAASIDPNMLNVNNLGYASFETVAYQRVTVIATELILLLTTCLWALNMQNGGRMITLIAFNAGLIFVDHMHFQYNGMLMGILVGCAVAAREQRPHLLAFLFTVLVLMKHLFVPLAPVVAVILLKHCMGPGKRILWPRVLSVTAVVLAVVAFAFGPLLASSDNAVEQLTQVLHRLFPFGRGLVHAYWAPNIWALYYASDKVLSFLCRKAFGMTFVSASGQPLANSASGLVGDFELHILPRVSPVVCAVLLLVCTIPAVFSVWRKLDANTILHSFAFVTLSSFMVGYHVHEKAILVPVLLYSLLPSLSGSDVAFFMVLSGVSTVSLFPLLVGKLEWFIKMIAAVGYLSICWHSLQCSKLQSLEQVVIVGVYTVLSVSIVYGDIVHPLLFRNADGSMGMPFLPLMQLSVVCALLLLRPWGYACLRLLTC